MTPTIVRSPLTGKWYVVTAWERPGVAKTKHDVTDQIEVIMKPYVPMIDVGVRVRDVLSHMALARDLPAEVAGEIVVAIMANLKGISDT